LLSSSGPQRFGEDARSLFEELQFFGGPLPRDLQETPISARTCGVQAAKLVACTVRKGRQDLQVLHSGKVGDREIGAEQAGEIVARFTWQPKPWLADAHLLRVHLRAPAGTTVGLPMQVNEPGAGESRQSVSLKSVSPDAGTSELVGKGSLASEPGIAVVELALQPGWYDRLAGGPLVVELRIPAPTGTPDTRAEGDAPKSSRRPAHPKPLAWFDGLTLVLRGGSPVSAPRSQNGPNALIDGAMFPRAGKARND
jgi:hypothetical protein